MPIFFFNFFQCISYFADEIRDCVLSKSTSLYWTASFFSKNYICQNNLDSPHNAAKAREVIDKEQGQLYHYWQYEKKTPVTSKGIRLSEARLYRLGHPSAPHLVFC